MDEGDDWSSNTTNETHLHHTYLTSNECGWAGYWLGMIGEEFREIEYQKRESIGKGGELEIEVEGDGGDDQYHWNN